MRGISVIKSWKIQRSACKGLHATSRSEVHYILRLLHLAPGLVYHRSHIEGWGRAFCRRLKRETSSSMARRSRSRNVITGALNLFEVHCEVRRDAAEVLMATRDPIHLHREACLASTLSASCRMLRCDYKLPLANYERRGENSARENGGSFLTRWKAASDLYRMCHSTYKCCN